MNVLKNLHSSEEGSVSFESVAIMGVAVLLLIIFQKYGGEALEPSTKISNRCSAQAASQNAIHKASRAMCAGGFSWRNRTSNRRSFNGNALTPSWRALTSIDR